MVHQQLRIVFMGTPAFAVASLEALVEAGCRIVAVVTAPDKPAGRGLQLQQSEVKKYALKQGLPVLQPDKLRDPGFLQQLRSLNADLQVVVAFRMLPEIVWSMPPMGSINLHASLLPRYRGAAPINWAIIRGEKETGVTTFRLAQEIDTGDILLQERLPIAENETAGEVHDRMMRIGARILVETVRGLAEGTLKPVPQTHSAPTSLLPHAPKIGTETCRIDFSRSVQLVHDHIRGLSPYPGAFTHLHGKLIKLFRTEKRPGPVTDPPGTFRMGTNRELWVSCSDGYLRVLELQLEGKKKMTADDFLRGNKV